MGASRLREAGRATARTHRCSRLHCDDVGYGGAPRGARGRSMHVVITCEQLLTPVLEYSVSSAQRCSCGSHTIPLTRTMFNYRSMEHCRYYGEFMQMVTGC